MTELGQSLGDLFREGAHVVAHRLRDGGLQRRGKIVRRLAVTPARFELADGKLFADHVASRSRPPRPASIGHGRGSMRQAAASKTRPIVGEFTLISSQVSRKKAAPA